MPLISYLFWCALYSLAGDGIMRLSPPASSTKNVFYCVLRKEVLHLIEHGRHVSADTVVVEEALDRAERRKGNLRNRQQDVLS